MREKIRHLYDLARLEACPEIKALKSDPAKFREMVAAVKEADEASAEFSGDWLSHPFTSAPLFTAPEIRHAMKEAYQNSSLQSLIWEPKNTPSFDQAWDLLMQVPAHF